MSPFFKSKKFVFVFLGLIAIIILNSFLIVVQESEQYLITRLGKPRNVITEAGVYFVIPFMENAIKQDKRILKWDGDPEQKNTKGNKYLVFDTTARWRIVDPLKFYQSVRDETGAQSRLDDILDSATGQTVSKLNLEESVRSSNYIIEQREKSDADKAKNPNANTDVNNNDENRLVLLPIKVGREKVQQMIKDVASSEIEKYGIELIDVRVKRLNYESSVQQKVFDRMISERKRIADKFRSQGRGKKAEIEGEMTKQLDKIESEAYRKSEEIKGKADAEAATIYANAYNKNKQFYDFYKTLETYKETLSSKHTFILSSEGEFFDELNK